MHECWHKIVFLPRLPETGVPFNLPLVKFVSSKSSKSSSTVLLLLAISFLISLPFLLLKNVFASSLSYKKLIISRHGKIATVLQNYKNESNADK